MATRSTPDDSVIREWNAEGLTREQMSDRWFTESGKRVSAAAFSMRLKRMPDYESKSPRYDFPWKVQNRHQHDGLFQMLRYVWRRRLKDPTLSEAWAEKARKFEESLIRDGLVIAYRPRTKAGFHKVVREAGDTDIVRVPAVGPGKTVRTPVNRAATRRTKGTG